MAKSNRRSYIDLSEAIRTLNVTPEKKAEIADLFIGLLCDEPEFSPERFKAHATSETDDGKWAYNQSIGEGPGTGGVLVPDEDAYDDED